MRLLRLQVKGSPQYVDEGINLVFFATDKVMRDDECAPLDVTRVGGRGSIYSLNVMGITGVNASGKTTTLNILRYVLEFMAGPYAMRQTYFTGVDRLGKLGDNLDITVVFWENGTFYLLQSELTHYLTSLGEASRGKLPSDQFSFEDETLWQLEASNLNRQMLLNSDEFMRHARIILKRNAPEDDPVALPDGAKTFLDDRESIVSFVTGKMSVGVEGTERLLHEITMPTPVIQAFDASVECLNWDGEAKVFHLKFKGEPERIVSREVAAQMLSSGTVAGAEMVSHAIEILRSGGYLIVDEIETSLNRSLVGVIIGLFSSPSTNPHGAQLVFTTHYPELLDLLHRKDSVYILIRDNEYKTNAVKYSDQVDRIENKKSAVILNNLIVGSMPAYPDVHAMREYVRKRVNE